MYSLFNYEFIMFSNTVIPDVH